MGVVRWHQHHQALCDQLMYNSVQSLDHEWIDHDHPVQYGSGSVFIFAFSMERYLWSNFLFSDENIGAVVCLWVCEGA